MRYISLGFAFVCLLVSLSADAAERDVSVSFGLGSEGGLNFRKAVSDRLTVFAGASMSTSKSTTNSYNYSTFNGVNTSTTTTNSSTAKNYSMSLGTRLYLSKETISSFTLLSVGESYSKSSSGDINYSLNSSLRSYFANVGYGLEYFIDPHFSIEAIAGCSMFYTPSVEVSSIYSSSSYSSSSRSISFPNIGTAITYYW
jgi:hypothetical protein